MRDDEYGNFRVSTRRPLTSVPCNVSSSAGTVYTVIYRYIYTCIRGPSGGDGGGPEGLILSSVIVAGQRHLCEEQTYLAQQAIHQIAPPDELGFHGETGCGMHSVPHVIKTSAGSRRRDEEQSATREMSRGKEPPVVARNEHSSLNVPSFSAENCSARVSPPRVRNYIWDI